MRTFRVWAPRARRVELVHEGGRAPLEAAERGWFRGALADARAGARYAYSLDGGPPRPDPRSRWQPSGPHGASALDDPAAFAWTDERWRGLPLPGCVLYELHVGTFSEAGTFEGVIDKLPHLVALGVDALELMPVAEFAGHRGWGYDGVALFAPHHAYGGPTGLRRLVDACHRSGVGVLLDVVYNHLGPAGNYLSEFGPYTREGQETGWGEGLNFDGPDSDEVRRFVIDNALAWLRDYHLDGLRLDAVHAILDRSPLHVLEQLADEVRALSRQVRRPLALIAESDANDPRLVRSREAGGFGLDAVWSDDWHHALHALVCGERQGYYGDYGSMEALAKALRNAWVQDGTWSAYRRRVRGRSPRGLSGERFVVCAQNHDQVGNRPLGERLVALAGPERARVAAALLLTSPFTPLLFQGEEWGASTPFQYFTDHEPELGRAVREGRRAELAAFGWRVEDPPDPQAEETFRRSRLAWGELEREPHARQLAWHRRLIALRRERPELSDPRPASNVVRCDARQGWLCVERGRVQVWVSLAPQELRLPAPGRVIELASSRAGTRAEAGELVLQADSALVVERVEA